MKKRAEITLALDTLRKREFLFKNKLKLNHFMDYNELVAQYNSIVEALEWILAIRNDFPFMEKFSEIAEENWIA